MQELTRFSKIEDVILIEENFTPEYKEIQSWLKSCFSYTKISIERGFINTLELNCISFDDISRTDKDRFKTQICPVYRLKDSDRALVKVNRGNDNSHLIIREIKDNSFSFYSTSRIENEICEGENEFCDTGIFNLKYSEYEIVYCIINKLAKYRLFDDKEEFETAYNFCKTLFDGTEKDFLKLLIHPYKLDGYSPYPYDYNKIEHYSDLKTCLLEIKNSLVNTSVPIANNLDTFLEIMTKIELIDFEIHWTERFERIIDFCHIERGSPIYQEWEYKKIKIKSLGGFDIGFDTKLKPIIENIEKYEFKNLDREGKKSYLNSLQKSQKIVIDCMERVIKLQNAFDIDIESRKMYSNSVQQTRYFTYALFKEMLSEPMHMNLPYYNDENVTRHFRNGNETVYITEGLLRSIYGNLVSRRERIAYLIVELSRVFEPMTIDFVLPEYNRNNTPTSPATEQPTNIKEFDNTTLTQIINNDMIDLFLMNERRLKADGYITSENKWINGRGKNQTKTLKDLANLILLLKEKNYLKLKLDRKQLKDSDYKKFFEVRYGCNLKEQFKKAQEDSKKRLETSKGAFIYF